MRKKLNINKTIITVISLNAIQILIIAAALIYKYIHNNTSFISGEIFREEYFLFMIIITVIINTFLTLRDFYIMKYEASQYDVVIDSLKKVEELNKTLRAQRHDFMNHLQVVYGLIDMNEYKDAKEYIDRIFNDIQKVNKVLKTAHPAINALLQAKVLFAEKRGIDIELHIRTQLKELKIPSWEFCRILGNIIDNSIYALQSNEGARTLVIEIYEDIKFYGFKIKNNGPKIDESIINKIFEAGFTTKGEKGEGMGLAITKDILNIYGGGIKVSSCDSETVFEGFVPRQI